MRIAATLTKEGLISKLPDGPYIVIFDTEKKDAEKYDNQGFTLKEGRRSAVVDLFIDKKVDTVITIPESFCDISYGKAKSNGIRFIRLNESLPYEEVIENLPTYLNNATSDIPEEELFKRR
ncbi:hypothetical protein [Thermoanaerobacterium thermosaccharolyticum]|uniref:Dinitrogenase iron-molybdenum cofactor biosynthesis domain-containing protein n=1 Tax=Thermoanaerobacterium thermosaccharolyticum M0795 TaxID=698948 RepID=L0IHZ6_THETR|nr:hypothetical protein [Thermoanaerobacterium thermosaccharolyticum]AGB17846.1 hypothetical protein Thethe_00107 [Thermoanaerobacterium thermosaccharolyticum M0795]